MPGGSAYKMQVAEHDVHVSHFWPMRDDAAMSYEEALAGLATDRTFRELMTSSLASAAFEAFFFETPPVSTETLSSMPFEFVLVDAPSLTGVSADQTAFPEHLAGCTGAGTVATFPNVSGDAILVAPCPIVGAPAYPHLAPFVRRAPQTQQHALWQAVATAMRARLADPRRGKVWMSTSGLGVYWLHVRLDDRPKYYTWSPYRTM